MSANIIIIGVLVIAILAVGGAIVAILIKKDKKEKVDSGMSFQQEPQAQQEPEMYTPQLQQTPAPAVMNDLNTPQVPVIETPEVETPIEQPMDNMVSPQPPVMDTPVVETPPIPDFNATPQAPAVEAPVVETPMAQPNQPTQDQINQDMKGIMDALSTQDAPPAPVVEQTPQPTLDTPIGQTPVQGQPVPQPQDNPIPPQV